MSTDDSAQDSTPGEPRGADAPPLLRVVKGNPTPEELAALVAVVAARAGGSGPSDAPEPLSEWAKPERLARTPVFPGPPMSWWASSLPR